MATIIGTAGSDRLQGGAGADTLVGGEGDDTYVITDALDAIVEVDGEGFDSVETTVDFVLASGVSIESVLALGSGVSVTGNADANNLYGDGYDNILNGAEGADYLEGDGGDDTFYVDNVGDVVNDGPTAATTPSSRPSTTPCPTPGGGRREPGAGDGCGERHGQLHRQRADRQRRRQWAGRRRRRRYGGLHGRLCRLRLQPGGRGDHGHRSSLRRRRRRTL
jgi:Ca2+-binding RTX toxin-like protein